MGGHFAILRKADPGQGARVLVYCPPNSDRRAGAAQIRVALTHKQLLPEQISFPDPDRVG
jgi:hypothetical protein